VLPSLAVRLLPGLQSLPGLPSLPGVPALPRRLQPVGLERWLARLLRDLTVFVEQVAAEAGRADLPSPDVLAVRLSDQLGREPTREETLRLLALLDGLESALCLSDGDLARARAAVSSYAEGLRRDAMR